MLGIGFLFYKKIAGRPKTANRVGDDEKLNIHEQK
jgi:hypothetical protein